jgi:hypothetical protein
MSLSGEDEEEEVDVVDEDEDEQSVVVLDQLNSIWDDKKVSRYSDNAGKKRWKCGWCKCDFGGWNATKAIAHVMKESNKDIKPCRAKIADEHKKLYEQLGCKSSKKRDRSKECNQEVNRSIGQHNTKAATALDDRKSRNSSSSSKRSKVSDNGDSPSLLSRFNSTSTPVSVVSEKASSDNKYIQLKIHGGPNPSAESKLTMAVVDCIHSCGLPFGLVSDPKFRKIIHLAKTVGSGFRLPGRNEVGTTLLELNYEAYMEKSMKLLLKEAETYGLTVYGDGATVKKTPLINILFAGAFVPALVMEIANCAAHMAAGGKKDARYIASLFRPYMDKIENEHPGVIDLIFFDGASNVQKGGRVLEASYPRVTVMHGAEHVTSLFFQDIFGYKELSLFKKVCQRAYKFFGSGAMHAPYSIFQKYAKIHNCGKNIGLMRASDTRMGGHAICMMRLLRLKNAIINTVTSVEFISLKVSKQTQRCIVLHFF